jgi:hypothetical protein
MLAIVAEEFMSEQPAVSPSAPSPVRNQVVWFDVPVKDLDRAIRF